MVNILAGVVQCDSNYFGANTQLSTMIFNVDFMSGIQFGWLEPQTDSGVGTASLVNSFLLANISPASGAKIGVDFWYNHSVNIRKRYFISCNSADLKAALESTDANNFVSLSVATGSGFTLLPGA